jgi:hypothetical protein
MRTTRSGYDLGRSRFQPGVVGFEKAGLRLGGLRRLPGRTFALGGPTPGGELARRSSSYSATRQWK